MENLPTSQAEQERLAAYVQRALPLALARRGIDWEVHVHYFDAAIFASLKRGTLRIEQGATIGTRGPLDWERGWEGRPYGDPPWWYPCTREQAQELTRGLADGLERSWRPYQGADSDGRLLVTVWRDPEREGRFYADPRPGADPVALRLGPGCRVQQALTAEWAEVRRLDGGKASIPEALQARWAYTD